MINKKEQFKNNNKSIEDYSGEELILFVSFDLVNSTKFKSYNSFNWFNFMYAITENIRLRVQSIDENFQLWKSIGDELIFTIIVLDSKKLEELIQKIFIVLNDIHKAIKNGSIFYENNNFNDQSVYIENIQEQNLLSIKATAWIALISKNKKNEIRKYNIQYEYLIANGTKIIDFLGNDIDIGFRISRKCTNPRRLALSLELAYFLSLNKSIQPKVHIITYIRLKGIWDNKLYPVIWYHDKDIAMCKINNSFFYDEAEEEELVKRYLESINKNENDLKYLHNNINAKLSNIINDRNLILKIERIEQKIKKCTLNASSKALKSNPSGELVEVYCVAVCIKDRKIFLAKRSNNCIYYKGQWEFGCCRILPGLNFSETLKKGYKENFNLDISVKNPFKEYEFIREKLKIAGIVYQAEIIDDSNIKLSNNYDDWMYINLDGFSKISRDRVIDFDEFEKIINYVLEDK